ncbi:MAG: hypothetical protein ABI217_11640, partial [Chthoniobacterales bacterium]
NAEEAKKLICKLILKGKGPARPWSHDAMEGLGRQLPIPSREIQLVAWFHRLPNDDTEHALKVRRQSEGSLMQNWSDEVTRAAAYRKKIGADPESLQKKDPALWREFFRWKYGPQCRLPRMFSDLGFDQQKEWKREYETFDESPEWWHPAARSLWGDDVELPNSILDLPDGARGEVLQRLRQNQCLTNAAEE